MCDKRLSVLLDESTDISNQKILFILVKYVNVNKIKTYILDMVKINRNERTAAELYGIFKNVIQDYQIKVKINKNIVGYCSDNASVIPTSKNSF